MPPKQKNLEKQAQLEAERQKKAELEAEKKAAAEWAVGAKDNSKKKAVEDKEEEKRRKAAEKAMLEAQEAAELGSIVTKKKPKKKGKDDFDLLNAALAQQPKSKAQKEAEAKKKAAEDRKKKEEEQRVQKELARKKEEDEARKLGYSKVVMNHTDELMVPIQNRLEDEDFEQVSGLDAAVGALTVGGDPIGTKNMKALYNAYFERQLPIFKEEHPGLKLSQYKDRIFDAWKKSPENPANYEKAS